jgi:hypothetical protein
MPIHLIRIVKLPDDYWERIIEILDVSNHPDSDTILHALHLQLYQSPSDVPATFTPDESNPNRLKRT